MTEYKKREMEIRKRMKEVEERSKEHEILDTLKKCQSHTEKYKVNYGWNTLNGCWKMECTKCA